LQKNTLCSTKNNKLFSTYISSCAKNICSITRAALIPNFFLSLLRFVEEIKTEDQEMVDGALHNYQMDVDAAEAAASAAAAEQGYLTSRPNPTNSCGFGNNPDQGNFLAKRSLGQTYLDLDSRCIAL
jgi:hypothetical protein